MTDDFKKALGYTLAFEGGYVNHPADKGGPTNKGITQRVYSAWRRERGQLSRDVRDIMSLEVEAIYEAQYWKAAHCDEMPYPLSCAVFDFAVNSGIANAIKTLQKCLGLKDDGIVGVVTRGAIHDANAIVLTDKYLSARQNFFWRIVLKNPSQIVFWNGWRNRIAGLRKILLP